MSIFMVREEKYFECPECPSRVKVQGTIRNGFSSSNIECVDCNVYMEEIEKPEDYKDPIESSLEDVEKKNAVEDETLNG